MSDWRFSLVPPPAPGTIERGLIDFQDRLLTGWDFPYVAVHGAKPGPAVLVMAGVHGSEYVSIDAAVRLGATLDAAEVCGQVLVLPLLNPAAFWQRTAFVSPIDNLNPNRAFPGKPLGTFTERLAYHVTEKAIRHADALMDLHGGDIPEALVAFTIFEVTGDAALDARTRAMAEAFGQESLLAQPAANAPIGGTTYATAARLGIPAILTEDGNAGVYDAAKADGMLEGTRNVLRLLGVLPGAAVPPPPQRSYGRFVWSYSQHAGFFKPRVQVGDYVTEGQLLGSVGDMFGATLEDIHATDTGRVLFLTISAAVGAPGLLCAIGTD